MIISFARAGPTKAGAVLHTAAAPDMATSRLRELDADSGAATRPQLCVLWRSRCGARERRAASLAAGRGHGGACGTQQPLALGSCLEMSRPLVFENKKRCTSHLGPDSQHLFGRARSCRLPARWRAGSRVQPERAEAAPETIQQSAAAAGARTGGGAGEGLELVRAAATESSVARGRRAPLRSNLPNSLTNAL